MSGSICGKKKNQGAKHCVVIPKNCHFWSSVKPGKKKMNFFEFVHARKLRVVHKNQKEMVVRGQKTGRITKGKCEVLRVFDVTRIVEIEFKYGFVRLGSTRLGTDRGFTQGVHLAPPCCDAVLRVIEYKNRFIFVSEPTILKCVSMRWVDDLFCMVALCGVLVDFEKLTFPTKDTLISSRGRSEFG